jgi:hypothetical protein
MKFKKVFGKFLVTATVCLSIMTCVGFSASAESDTSADGHQHIMTDSTVAATVDSEGYTSHECSVCGYSYNDSYTDKLIDLTSAQLTLSQSSYTYSGSEKKPTVTVKYDGKTVDSASYTVKYSSNVNAGTGYVTVTGKGSCVGTKKISFTIKPYSISKIKASIPSLNYTYTGSGRKPEPTVKVNGKKLKKGTDYTVSYKNNVKVGSQTATVTVTGKGNYTGSTSRKFNITKRNISTCKIGKISTKYYTGKAIKPSPTVKYGDVKFTKGTDYTLSYKNNKNCGTATVTIKGKGRLKGSVTVKFKITSHNVVTEFGANPNDSKSDKEAIQQALNLARDDSSGNITRIYFPAGTYHIDGILSVYSNTYIYLNKKAVIVNDSGDTAMLFNVGTNKGYQNAGNITIEGGVWDGNAGNFSRKSSAAIMVFRNASNINLLNTTLRNANGNHFAIFDGIKNSTVKNTTFKKFYSYKGSASSYDFYTNQTSADDKKSAIGSIEALHLDFATDGTPCKNVEVSGCTFNDVPSGVGTHHSSGSKYAEDITVHDNTFKNVWFICVHGANYKNLKVYNNTAENCSTLFRAENTSAEVYKNTFSGLEKVSSSRYPTSKVIYSVLVQESSNVNFHDNKITNSNGTGIFYKNNCKGTIKKNTVNGCTVNGIFIENSVVDVLSNTVKSCKSDGIRIMGSKVNVKSNTVTGCTSNCIDLYRGCYSSTVKNNKITSKSKLYISGDSSVSVSGNSYS